MDFIKVVGLGQQVLIKILWGFQHLWMIYYGIKNGLYYWLRANPTCLTLWAKGFDLERVFLTCDSTVFQVFLDHVINCFEIPTCELAMSFFQSCEYDDKSIIKYFYLGLWDVFLMFFFFQFSCLRILRHIFLDSTQLELL